MAFAQVLTAERTVRLAEIALRASADPSVAHTDADKKEKKKQDKGVWGEARTRGFKWRQILLRDSQLGLVSIRSVKKNCLDM